MEKRGGISVFSSLGLLLPCTPWAVRNCLTHCLSTAELFLSPPLQRGSPVCCLCWHCDARCKSGMTEKHIAREIIMQRFCLWQKPGDTKPRHQNNISQLAAMRHNCVNRIDNHYKTSFTKAAIDVIVTVVFFSWPDKVLCQWTMQKKTLI